MGTIAEIEETSKLNKKTLVGRLAIGFFVMFLAMWAFGAYEENNKGGLWDDDPPIYFTTIFLISLFGWLTLFALWSLLKAPEKPP